MLRLRRYRVFLFAAVVVTFSLYHLAQIRYRDAQSVGVDRLKELGHHLASSPPPTPTQSSTLLDYPDVSTSSTPIWSSENAEITASHNGAFAVNEVERISDEEDNSDGFGSYGQGRLEINPESSVLERPHWILQKQHFPVPSDLIIQLPTGRPKRIPAIQHVFATETLNVKNNNEQKLQAIKKAFEHAWSGYKEYAMPHDELAPVSKGFKDPFNGWGATLVDTLDTLWIMDLKDEFEEAIAEVRKIDFKTSIRKDIPLFETVIRYLGGLVAAYDVSSGKYSLLLDKAVELAEILMGAFDTPNRMPQTYYHWAPSYASQPHRAASKVVLAELGSLSLEFTRLAQITGDNKYYDAIARITDELEAWQNNTKLPGLWPVSVDASGCKKADRSSAQMAHSASYGPQRLLPPVQGSHTGFVDKMHTSSDLQNDKNSGASQSQMYKRQLDDAGILDGEEPAQPPSDGLRGSSTSSWASEVPPKDHSATMDGVDCQHQGLASPPFGSVESFTLGGMSDSVYEYLPKEWILLGGLNGQYESMYREAMDVVRSKLLYRPMIPKTGHNVLFAGTMHKSGLSHEGGQAETPQETMEYESQHLTCFAGGMFALGAKVFGMDDDLAIASGLADGCVWAYESTATGIMPEAFRLVPCANRRDCMWNETEWWEALDPYRSTREEQTRIWYDHQRLLGQGTPADEGEWPDRMLHTNMPVPATESAELDIERDATERGASITTAASENALPRRQTLDLGEPSGAGNESLVKPTETQSAPAESRGDDRLSGISQSSFPIYAPTFASHEDFVQARIKEERLPPGFADINNKKYILRPEAIESVFIMYRVTGDRYWQEQGWKMFTAIQTYTLTEHGNSAITDVTSKAPLFFDDMESFWLAETLKYFYLLFSDPDLISLDDYVL